MRWGIKVPTPLKENTSACALETVSTFGGEDQFRCSEIIGGGGVRFLYGIPDSFSEEQKAISDLVTKEAIDEFGIWFRENVEL